VQVVLLLQQPGMPPALFVIQFGARVSEPLCVALFRDRACKHSPLTLSAPFSADRG
jgi:hypothetical protein